MNLEEGKLVDLLREETREWKEMMSGGGRVLPIEVKAMGET
jgi:hypothetical protein